MRKRILGWGLLAGMVACGGVEPLTDVDAVGPAASIEDAVHNNGNEAFYWLPPMVSNPAYSGTFDPTLDPAVDICEWDGASCVLPLVAEFTTTSGPGGETVDVSGSHYQVNWHTDEFGLDETKTYRIVVQIGGQELGHADVDVVDKGKELKNVDTGEFIPLLNGRTLPIKFRIEEGLVLDDEGPVSSDVTASPDPVSVGETVDLTAVVDDAGTGGSVITSAEYNVDGGTYTAMTASDGTFDGVTENVEATVPAFATAGTYTLCVRGTDAAGNTGADTCTTVTVKEVLWSTVGIGGFSGSFFTCGITTTGDGYCWGSSEFGQGGAGHANRNNHVPQAIGGGRTLVSVDPLSEAHCALADDGTAWCSGNNGFGVLGTTVSLPVAGEACAGGRPCSHDPLMVETTVSFTELHTFQAVGCGLSTDSLAYCWGTFQAPYLGAYTGTPIEPCQVGPDGCSRTPVPVDGGHKFISITAGAASCGLTAPGDSLGNVWCWGYQFQGAFGNGNTTASFVPVRAASGMTFAQIDGGAASTCALTDTGDAYCWGSNTYGRLGDGTTTDRLTPVAVAGGLTFSQISTSEETESHTCGITTSGAAYCWGLNSSGQLGDGTTTNSSVPVAVTGGLTFTYIATGGMHTCGVTDQQDLYCWGSNSYGQLGIDPAPNSGDALPHPSPGLVLNP